jgi:3-oxoacyl-[acyl-carrier protein] reductase
MLLENKVCIVTGSSKGIGFAIAGRFLKEGAAVIINSRSEDTVKSVVASFKSSGFQNADGFAGNVSVKSIAADMAEYALKKYGKIDVLVNNAGINKIAPSVQLAEEDYRAVLDTNLCGVFFCCQEVGKIMLKAQSGSIVNISSVFGQETVSGRAAYTSSKAGVIGLTKVLGVEWAKDNVRVNSVAPAYIATDMGIGDQADGGYDD